MHGGASAKCPMGGGVGGGCPMHGGACDECPMHGGASVQCPMGGGGSGVNRWRMPVTPDAIECPLLNGRVCRVAGACHASTRNTCKPKASQVVKMLSWVENYPRIDRS